MIVLGIAYTAITRLGSLSQQSINAALSRESFNEFSIKANETCMLGEGNVRVVDVKGESATLVPLGSQQLNFTAPHFWAIYDSPCGFTLQQTGPSKEFTIKNNGGTTEIS